MAKQRRAPSVMTREQAAEKGRIARKYQPDMATIKSLPGYREDAKGWSAPASAWYEASKPFFEADDRRHRNNLGNAAYDPSGRLKGETVLYERRGKLYRITPDGEEEVA